jgi:hypothetical protein
VDGREASGGKVRFGSMDTLYDYCDHNYLHSLLCC